MSHKSSRFEDRLGEVLFGGLILSGLAFLPRSYDGSALTYVIVAEEGLFKFQQAAHPLYVPLLRLIGWFAEVLTGGRLLEAAQWTSLLAGGIFLILLYRLARHFSGDAWSSFWAAAFFGSQKIFWVFSMQSKPYTIAASLAAATLLTSVLRKGKEADHSLRRGAAAGALAGFAIGFDAFNIALIPIVLIVKRYRRELDRPFAAGFFSAVFITTLIGLTFLPVSPFKLFALMQTPDLPSWAVQRDLGFLIQKYFGSFSVSMPGLAALVPLGVLALLPQEEKGLLRRAALFGFLIFVSYSLLFILFNAHGDYEFIAVMGFAGLLAVLGRGKRGRRMVVAVAAIICGGHTFVSTILPMAGPKPDEIRIEGEFLTQRLGPKGLLVAAGAPDWRLAYLYKKEFFWLRLDKDAVGKGLFDSPIARIDNEALSLIDDSLNEGNVVLLAADRLFRPESVWSPGQVDAYVESVESEMVSRFSLGRPLVSPRGQWYVPVRSRR